MKNLTFRNASESDVGLILEYIKKLADYENRLDEVIPTEDSLRKWIFDKTRPFDGFDNQIVNIDT